MGNLIEEALGLDGVVKICQVVELWGLQIDWNTFQFQSSHERDDTLYIGVIVPKQYLMPNPLENFINDLVSKLSQVCDVVSHIIEENSPKGTRRFSLDLESNQWFITFDLRVKENPDQPSEISIPDDYEFEEQSFRCSLLKRVSENKPTVKKEVGRVTLIRDFDGSPVFNAYVIVASSGFDTVGIGYKTLLDAKKAILSFLAIGSPESRT